MQFKLTVIIAIFAIAVSAAPVPMPASGANALIPRLLPGDNTVGTNGTVHQVMAPAAGSTDVPPERTMTDTTATNTNGNVQPVSGVTTSADPQACNVAFDTAQTTIEASKDLTATLNGLISQNKAVSSLVKLYANNFKTLWPGYSTTIKTEFKPFAVTLPPTDAICRTQIDVCLNSLLSTSKLIASSPSGAAAACTVTRSVFILVTLFQQCNLLTFTVF